MKGNMRKKKTILKRSILTLIAVVCVVLLGHRASGGRCDRNGMGAYAANCGDYVGAADKRGI